MRHRTWAGSVALAALILLLPGTLAAQAPADPLGPPAPIDQVADPLPPPPPPPTDQPPPAGGASTNGSGLLDPTRVQAGSFATLAGPMATMFSPIVGNIHPRLTLVFQGVPDQNVAVQGTRLGWVNQDMNFIVPLYQDSHDEWTLNAGVRGNEYHTAGTILPSSKVPFPDDLWSVRLGAGYRHAFASGWTAGINVGVGSASDQPFHSIHEMTESISAFVRIPTGERNAWLLSLNYSPTSEIQYPLPGVAYLCAPTEQIVAAIGLPLLVMYRPLKDLFLTFSYVPIRTIHAQATYRIWGPWRAYLAYNWGNESWFLADRMDDRERLFYYDQRVTTGLQCNLATFCVLDISGGYAFDRFFFQGVGSTDQHNDRVDVGNGFVGTIRATVRW